MKMYKIGDKIPELDMAYDGIRTGFDDGGATVVFHMSGITDEDLEAFKSGSPMKIGFFSSKNLLFMLYRFGDWQWMDSPYDPHIGKMPSFDDIEDGKSIRFLVLVVDTNGGVIKWIRLVSPSTDFSRKLVKEIRRISACDFDEESYDKKLSEIYDMYETVEMVRLADCVSKVKES